MVWVDSLTSALSAYLVRRNTPYAVMINGSWGVGKTYYLLNTLIPAYDQFQFHYLSLYGLQSVKDIEERIIDQIDSPVPDKNVPVQVVCLDDLERWHGNIDHCFSVVNQLVEHRHCKCILIGNLDEITSEGTRAFSRAQEKMIRNVYHFNPPIGEIIKISLNLVEPTNKTAQHFLRSLINSNWTILLRYLTSIPVRNIRLITESLQLFELVYQHHPRAFKTSPKLAFTYLLALISLLLLVKRHILEKSNRSKLLEGEHASNKGFKFLVDIGYFDEELSSGLTEESRLLLDTIFYRLDKISLRGLCSIVKNGFYLKADFETDFDQWQDEKHFELYLDKHHFYELENNYSEQVFKQALDAFITRCDVKNPVTLLLLAERVVDDIANGVVDYDPILFRKQVFEVVDKLYDNDDMEYVEVNIFDLAGDRFVNCRSIYNYIISRNNKCRLKQAENDLEDFWQQIFQSPELSDSLITQFPTSEVFTPSMDLRKVVKSLEPLNNMQLNRLVNWVEAGFDESGYPTKAKTVNKMHLLARRLQVKFGETVGIKANQFRRLSRVLAGN